MQLAEFKSLSKICKKERQSSRPKPSPGSWHTEAGVFAFYNPQPEIPMRFNPDALTPEAIDWLEANCQPYGPQNQRGKFESSVQLMSLIAGREEMAALLIEKKAIVQVRREASGVKSHVMFFPAELKAVLQDHHAYVRANPTDRERYSYRWYVVKTPDLQAVGLLDSSLATSQIDFADSLIRYRDRVKKDKDNPAETKQ